MPIPDEIVPPQKETDDQKKERERWEAVNTASNDLGRKSLICGQKVFCYQCKQKCQELKAWIELDKDEKNNEGEK